MEKLEIIVPIYNRGRAIIPTVQSLKLQTNRNFSAHFIFDGVDYAAENAIFNIFPTFPSDIDFIEHSGVGAARNYGIECSKSPYIMFLDSDDLLLPNAVGTIMNAIDHGFDTMVGKTMREAENGNFEVVGGEQMTWIHGRVYSRAFLDKYNIRFPNLPMCEDLAFNMLCAEFAHIVPETQWPIHIQRYTQGSLSRSEGAYRRQAENYIEACLFYLDSALLHKKQQDLILLPSALATCYYYLDSVEREFPGDKVLYHKMCEQFTDLVGLCQFYSLDTIPAWHDRFALALAAPSRPFRKVYTPNFTFKQTLKRAEMEADGE